MSSTILRRLMLAVAVTAMLAGTYACRSQSEPEKAAPSAGASSKPDKATTIAGTSSKPAAAELKNEIPADVLDRVMTAHFEGLGQLEQYNYGKAIDSFRTVRELAPGWIPGSINLAIALLNKTGEEQAAKKKPGAPQPDPASSEEHVPENFQQALDLLEGVLRREPDNLHAHYCIGVILHDLGRFAEAHRHFRRVVDLDPNDPAAWYNYGATITDSANPAMVDPRKLAREQIEPFSRALALDPYLVQALYRLQRAYVLNGQRDKGKELFQRWQALNPDGPAMAPGTGNSLVNSYGEMGKYATAIDPFRLPGKSASGASRPPRFGAGASVDVKLAAGERWVKPADFTGPMAVVGRIRDRFGAAVAAFDADGDGKLDLYLASAVVGPKGVHDALLLSQGRGKFREASAEFGLPADRASVGVATGDFDADQFVDVFLSGVGANRLLRNRGGKGFEDISTALKPAGPKAVSLAARWIDLDQDGDLDLYVVNYCAAEGAEKAFVAGGALPGGVPNLAYRNDGQPDPGSAPTVQGRAPLATAYDRSKVKTGLTVNFSSWPEKSALTGGDRAHVGVALLDLENDRDLDLVLLNDGAAPVAVLNDRLGRFHEAPLAGLSATTGSSGLLATDLDGDGKTDLVAPAAGGPVLAWRNVTERATADATKITFETWPINASRWRAAQAVDLDLDGLADLLGSPSPPEKAGEPAVPAWARNEGKRLAVSALPVALEHPGVEGILAVDLVGNALPDLLVMRPGEPPAIAANQGNGHHWVAIQLVGYWRVKPELMRSNVHGIGTRILLEGQGVHATYDHCTPESGLGQSVAPFVLGLGKQTKADLIHVLWPDGVLQCELNLAADDKRDLPENNRKTGSCPVLFTWNGERMVCLGDFLGGGGMGYLVAPGVYSQPDRDESMAISGDQLQPDDGVLKISVTEPMDEVCYIDHLRLEVVDRPPGVTTTPDERFAPDGPRPTGELIAWRSRLDPVKASDLEGRNLTNTLRDFDRRTADAFRMRAPWIGYAEEHGIILDFGDRLAKYSPRDRLVLCLAGWVEYPYSQTNYAAATAGVTLKAPSIERRRNDGTWEVIEPHAGYPAGLPRLMTIELTGKLTGPRCELRIRTNMECYYDQAFLAVLDASARESLQVTTLPVARATLGHRGYTREVSPDGRPPLLYDYDYVDPAPLAWFSGKLTRYGDVAELLQKDDDRLCLVGPGDEIRVEFDAKSLPSPRPGWTRSYVLRSYGYCKDADPFTAKSDTVEPLPWKGMPAFPFGADVKRPADPGYSTYLREYQTRPAGGN